MDEPLGALDKQLRDMQYEIKHIRKLRSYGSVCNA